ncbi:MAG: hypothetical protein ACRDXB_11650, partial [Actinomycetes bacterium]
YVINQLHGVKAVNPMESVDHAQSVDRRDGRTAPRDELSWGNEVNVQLHVLVRLPRVMGRSA